MIEAVAHETLSLAQLSAALDLTKSTTHRLATSAVIGWWGAPRNDGKTLGEIEPEQMARA